MLDGKEFGRTVVDTVKGYVRTVLQPIEDRLKSLELRSPEKGEKGEDGAAGVGVASALIDRDGGLVVTLSSGETLSLGRVVGEPGQPGKDGADGFGFDDLSVEYDGKRGFTFKFAKGERVKEFPFSLPVVLDAGIYKSGGEYEAGDGVTHGGSFWIAQKETAARPGDGSDDWRLSVKRGRDGKSAQADEPREPVQIRLK